jgi:hypothetical protein
MKPRLFTLLSAVSLLLCVATVGLWVRSYWVEDSLDRYRAISDHVVARWLVRNEPGSCELTCGITTNDQVSVASYYPTLGLAWDAFAARHRDPRVTTFGFRFEHLNSQFGAFSIRQTIVAVPHWVPALVFAATPCMWLLRERRRRAALRAVGCCKNCGYDLRATPEHCPECGTVAGRVGG